MAEPARAPLAVGICYQNPRAALKWLETAFGFETVMVIENPDGSIGHSEMTTPGGGSVMVGREWDEWHKSPASIGGVNTQSVHLNMPDGFDLDSLWRAALQAGAKTEREPADQFYGERSCGVTDLEGHHWTFSTRLKTMTPQEMADAGGVKITEKLEG
jgi:uncharacterized glyoxalase superfamily protein PhnB